MEGKSKKIVPLKKLDKNVNFGPIAKKNIFLEWEWKTGLNGPIKCPNFEKKSNGNVLQVFSFAFHIVSHNVKGKPKWSQKSSHNVENKSKWRHLMSHS